MRYGIPWSGSQNWVLCARRAAHPARLRAAQSRRYASGRAHHGHNSLVGGSLRHHGQLFPGLLAHADPCLAAGSHEAFKPIVVTFASN